MNDFTFSKEAFEDYLYWQTHTQFTFQAASARRPFSLPPFKHLQ